MRETAAAERVAQMANPATLSAVLGLTAREELAPSGNTPAAARGYVLQRSFCHLKAVFDASSLVDTPVGFLPVPDTDSTVAARAAALAMHGLIEMETVSYGSENDGHLFVNLVVMPGAGAFAEKSQKPMRGHTDAVSFPFNGEDDPENVRIAPSPDLVTLVGLRNPENVPTNLMSLPDVLDRLSVADVDELKKPQYSIRSQKTFAQGTKRILGTEHVVIDQPLLKDVAAGALVRYSHSSVIATKAGGRAEQAAKNFEAACSDASTSIVVEPGDVVIINNRLSLHGRGKVGGQVGGQSRWLLRTYGLDTSKIDLHKRHLGSRPPHVLFP